MSLIIYPTGNYDSFVSVVDADTFITNYDPKSEDWLALTEAQKETYLRISTQRILDNVSTDADNADGYLDESTYVASDSCLPKACSLMAIHDLVFSISSGVNENTGLVSKEKVGDVERSYFHGHTDKQVKGLNKNPFPQSVIKCLNSYGATVSSSNIKQMKIVRS
jgi:hypothetical protein